MTAIEIIFAILLILACIFIITVVLMQESKQGMSNVISGGSTDNYFSKNSGRTKEAQLARATKIAAILLFVITIAVNLISVYFGGDSAGSSTSSNSALVTDADFEAADTPEEDTDAGEEEDTTESAETEAAAEETEAAETTAAAE